MAKQLRIAVVGKSGHGRSSVANSIIGKNVFNTGLSANRVTKVTSLRTKRLSSGQDIVVFDTPGLYQEGEDESEIRKEIEKSIVSPGLHAVVFVIKSGCFKNEEQEAVEQMKTLFGTSIFSFTIFAFTCINDLGTQPLEGFVHESVPVYLKAVIRENGSRSVGFDNRDKTMDQESVKKIISLVADMSQTNKDCLYSRELFEEAFQANMKRKKEEREKNGKQRPGANDLIADMNLKTRVASDTQFKGENQSTKSGNDERFVAKGEEIASDMEAYLTVNVAGRDARDTEVHGPGLHAEEGRTGDTVNSSSTLQLPKSMAKVNEMQSQTDLKESMERRSYNMKKDQESYGIPPNELRLVIIGKSGNGKSSTANTIIGRNIFKTGATATSITKETATHRASRFGKEILLIDTPGLFDPEIERKETEDEISRCMCMTLPGFHAFLFVVRVGRFTAEELNTVKEFEKLFGEKLYEFMIIVFTRMDDLVREGKELDEFVHCDIPPNLKQIIERCNHRYVGLNNIESPENKQEAIKNLVEMIEKMIDSKDPNHYTNEAFEKAEKDLREQMSAAKEGKKAAKKAELEKMFAEKEMKMREELVTEMTEMKNAWGKERKQQEEEAKRIRENDREMMEGSFTAKIKAIQERETKVREALFNTRDDWGRATKERDMKENEEKEMLDKLKADREKRRIDLSKRFDNERKSKEKEWEEMIEKLLTEQKKRMEFEFELHREREVRYEETRNKSTWFRLGKWMGFHD